VQDEDGTLHWTSPMGRVYDTEPENRFGSAPAPAADTTPEMTQDDPPPF
jgi:hypothetical protein